MEEIVISNPAPVMNNLRTVMAESFGRRYFFTCDAIDTIKKMYTARNIKYINEAIVCIKRL